MTTTSKMTNQSRKRRSKALIAKDESRLTAPSRLAPTLFLFALITGTYLLDVQTVDVPKNITNGREDTPTKLSKINHSYSRE